jgi:P-type Ca2+ transporter type 2C
MTATKEQSGDSRLSDALASTPKLERWYVLPLAEVVARLQTDATHGLTQDEAVRRLARHGPNTLPQAQQRSAWSILLAQFRSLIVALLVAATAIAFAMGEHIEAVAILVVIVLNACIGFVTEWKAGQALSALQKQSVRLTHVVRDGAEKQIPAAELVPGDLIVLAAGARVPADGRIVESAAYKSKKRLLLANRMRSRSPRIRSPTPRRRSATDSIWPSWERRSRTDAESCW